MHKKILGTNIQFQNISIKIYAILTQNKLQVIMSMNYKDERQKDRSKSRSKINEPR
jgi:hypothetical protein